MPLRRPLHSSYPVWKWGPVAVTAPLSRITTSSIVRGPAKLDINVPGRVFTKRRHISTAPSATGGLRGLKFRILIRSRTKSTTDFDSRTCRSTNYQVLPSTHDL